MKYVEVLRATATRVTRSDPLDFGGISPFSMA